MNYSIIQVNLNGYDKASSCYDTKSEKNLLITDKPQNVTGWTQQIYKNSNKDFPFDDVFKIRWNVFNYLNTDYVIWIDGSNAILGNLDCLIQEMKKQQCDFAIVQHPFRDNFWDEYQEWCRLRHYDRNRAFEWLNYFQENGIDLKHSGLYQANVMIFKNCDKVKKFSSEMLKELHTFDKDHLDRLDQTVATYLLKTKFKDIKILELPKNIYHTNLINMVSDHGNRI